MLYNTESGKSRLQRVSKKRLMRWRVVHIEIESVVKEESSHFWMIFIGLSGHESLVLHEISQLSGAAE